MMIRTAQKALCIVLILLALLASCTPTDNVSTNTTIPQIENGWAIRVFHDDERGVTCWTYKERGISCLPDHDIYSIPPR